MDFYDNLLLDDYINLDVERIADYKTEHSGLDAETFRTRDLRRLSDVQTRILRVISGRPLVGFAIGGVGGDLARLRLVAPSERYRLGKGLARFHIQLSRFVAPDARPHRQRQFVVDTQFDASLRELAEAYTRRQRTRHVEKPLPSLEDLHTYVQARRTPWRRHDSIEDARAAMQLFRYAVRYRDANAGSGSDTADAAAKAGAAIIEASSSVVND